MSASDLQLGLEKLLSRQCVDQAPVKLSGLRPLGGGASADIWYFEAESGGSTEALILRLNATDEEFFGSVGKALEAKLQARADAAGVPVAPVKAVLSELDGLGTGYIMAYVAGETIPQKILKQERYSNALSVMTQQCGEILAKIHSISIDDLSAMPILSVEQQILKLKNEFLSYEVSLPIFALAFRWLLDNIPPQQAMTLVHGDFRNGNFIVDENGIKAVVDWELAHIGDPLEDLGWLCVNSWRFGRRELPVGGFGRREELCEVYEKARDCKIDLKALKFWELYGCLRWGVICVYQARLYLAGESTSLERAAIGRRVSETEIDMMVLLKELSQS